MQKAIFIIVSFFVLGCMADNKKQSAVYDKAALKMFVLNTSMLNEMVVSKQLDSILTAASNDSVVLHQTISFLAEPFSNPNSSYRNQNLYAKLLKAEMNSKWYGGYEKEVAAGKLKLLQQNNVGNAANDFTYTTPAGYKKRMYDINADFLLLYFNNPGCNACKEMKQALSTSTIINQKIQSGQLKILSIYTDKDEKIWLDHLNEYPDSWIQGRDENEFLYMNKVYDLRAIPTIYLLDRDKKVLFKDCVDVREVEGKLYIGT
jgi:thioredoxin-related protein